MEVTTFCRKGSTNAKTGIALWTFEIIEKRIVHQSLAPGSRRDWPALKRYGRTRDLIEPSSPSLLAIFLGGSLRRYRGIAHSKLQVNATNGAAWSSRAREVQLNAPEYSGQGRDGLVPERHHSEPGPECIGDEIGHARASSRKKRLQGLDRQTDGEPKSDGDRNRMFSLSQLREIGVEEEAQRNEADDVDADILPIMPAGTEFVPRLFQEPLM